MICRPSALLLRDGLGSPWTLAWPPQTCSWWGRPLLGSFILLLLARSGSMWPQAKVALMGSVVRALRLRLSISTCAFVELLAYLDAFPVESVDALVLVPFGLVLPELSCEVAWMAFWFFLGKRIHPYRAEEHDSSPAVVTCLTQNSLSLIAAANTADHGAASLKP